jgi:hypothetical protein
MLSICSRPVSLVNRLSAHSSSRTLNRKDLERFLNYLGINKSFAPRRPEYKLIMNNINSLLKINPEFQLRFQSLLNAENPVTEIDTKRLEKLIKKSNKK